MLYFIKFYIRNIYRRKSSSFITIMGFALSMSVALILSSFIISEKSYDKHFENHKRIYRLINNRSNSATIEEGIKEKMMGEFPQVELMCNYDRQELEMIYNDQKYKGTIADTDKDFFEIFSVPIIAGNKNKLFTEKNSLVITESMAKNVFGDINPIGEIVNVGHSKEFRISAICSDIPKESSIYGDYFINYKDKFAGEQRTSNDLSSWLNYVFILEKENIDITKYNETISIQIYEKQIFKELNDENEAKNLYRFQPLDEIYFDTSLDGDRLEHANIKLIGLMTWIVIIIYALAIFNYINLTTALSTDRLKEIGVRKTIGAGNRKIFMQIISESLFTCIISFAFAFVISNIISPIFEGILGKEINLDIIYSSPVIILISTCCIVITGFISGIYPSLVALAFSPRVALQKLKTGFNDAIFRQSLNVLQFTISITLIICVMIIMKQIDYVKHKDIGFDAEKLVRFYIHREINDNKDYFINELTANANIKNVTFTQGCPGDIWNTWGGELLDNVSTIPADKNFAETFKLDFIEGRDFLRSDGGQEIIINETFKKLTGWETIEGKEAWGRKVVGVVKDFHYSNMHEKIGPVMILNTVQYAGHATVRIAGSEIMKNIKFIESKFKELEPMYDFEYNFYDEWFEKMYKQEENYAKTVRIFGILAIVISCLGLFGLAEFSIKKRTKEIGIRKVNGADTSSILAALNSNFILWVVIAFLIASPLGWYIMKKWLESFAYKTVISWWIFALAGLMALTVSLLTISWRSWRAARRNPVEALRYE